MRRINRRRLLGGAVLLGAGAAGLPNLAACGDDDDGGGGDGGGTLRFAWWGNPDRDERTNNAVRLWAERTGRTVNTEPANWEDHWASLTTQVAGGNPPDLMQQDYQYLKEYVQNGSLLALDDHVPDPLTTDQIPEDTVNSGRFDGALYAISMGYNTFALVSNQGVLADAGEEQPDDTLTWSQFFDLAVRIGENTEDGVFGSENAMNAMEPFECWLRQRGKELYTADGQLAYEAADVEEWYQYWMDMIAAGGCFSTEADAEGTGALEDRGVPTRTGAFDFHWSNVITAFVDLTDDEVGVTQYPQGDTPGSPNGQYYKASMYLSVPSDASDPEGAVDLMSALIFDPEIAGELGFERGIPAAAPVRDALEPSLSEAEQLSLEYVSGLEGIVGAIPPPPPGAHAQIYEQFTFFSEEAGFGNLSVADAAQQFFDEANRLLEA
jgi:multiple sugar transport system substrate-binding protein